MELNDFVSKLWFEHNGQPCKLYGLPVVEDAEVLIQYPDGKFEETKTETEDTDNAEKSEQSFDSVK